MKHGAVGLIVYALLKFGAVASLLIVLGSYSAHTSATSIRSYPIYIEGCPSELHVRLPNQFARAIGSEEIKRRDAVLSGLHSNPGRKARYSDIFLVDWKDEVSLPSISIGALGSSISHQGKVADADWQRLKRNLVSTSQTERDRWVSQYIDRLEPGQPPEMESIKAKVLSVTAEKPKSVVSLGTSTTTKQGRRIESYIAAKLVYSKRCLVYIGVAVDAARPDSFEELVRIVSAIEVE